MGSTHCLSEDVRSTRGMAYADSEDVGMRSAPSSWAELRWFAARRPAAGRPGSGDTAGRAWRPTASKDAADLLPQSSARSSANLAGALESIALF